MGRDYWLVSELGRKPAVLTGRERASFEADAMEIAMYSVGPGEAIVVSRGGNAILVDGGSDSTLAKNDRLGRKFANLFQDKRIVGIVASHPHKDHTNFYHVLVSEFSRLFAAHANYFDNATPAADDQWAQLENWRSDLPFARTPITDNPRRDGLDRIPRLSAEADAHLLRATSGARSKDGQKYWSIFMFLRFRKAWMLFTGDAYQGYEVLLLNRLKAISRRAHVLKVTHHGSSDGTSERLVLGLRPAISIASSDKDSGHRLEPDVRERLSISEIYATYEAGSSRKDIFVRTDGRIHREGGSQGILLEVETRNATLR